MDDEQTEAAVSASENRLNPLAERIFKALVMIGVPRNPGRGLRGASVVGLLGDLPEEFTSVIARP